MSSGIAGHNGNGIAEFSCRAVAGRGKAGGYVESSADEIERLTGWAPFPGTLNLVARVPVKLDPARAKTFGGGHRLVWPARLNGIDVLVYRVKSLPDHVFEIVSPQRLRGVFDDAQLQDLTLVIDRSFIARTGWLESLAWRLVWKGRETLYYSDDRYERRARRIMRHFR